jgi:hypothetical protein
MAKGGARPGAGRPKGSITRPQLRDFYDKQEIEEFVADLKEAAKKDNILKKFVAEQLFGRAPSPSLAQRADLSSSKGVEITVRKK